MNIEYLWGIDLNQYRSILRFLQILGFALLIATGCKNETAPPPPTSSWTLRAV